MRSIKQINIENRPYYFFNDMINIVHIKMSYYWFNRQELLQKAKDKYHKANLTKLFVSYPPAG